MGLHLGTSRAELVWAILEGLVFTEYDVLEAASVATEIVPDRVVITGGGSRNPTWNAIRRSVFGIPVDVATSDPVRGAALLAYMGSTETSMDGIPGELLTEREQVPTRVIVMPERRKRYEKAKQAVLGFCEETHL